MASCVAILAAALCLPVLYDSRHCFVGMSVIVYDSSRSCLSTNAIGEKILDLVNLRKFLHILAEDNMEFIYTLHRMTELLILNVGAPSRHLQYLIC